MLIFHVWPKSSSILSANQLRSSVETRNNQDEIDHKVYLSPPLLSAGLGERDPVGNPERSGGLRPGRGFPHLPALGRHGVLGPGWRNRLHPDVSSAVLRPLLQDLQRLWRHCWLPRGLCLEAAVWRSAAGVIACAPFPRVHL